MKVTVERDRPVKITKPAIEKAWKRRATGKRLVIPDMDCRGLVLIVNPTSMAWSYSFKPRGVDAVTGKRFATRSVTIGSPETHDPDAARDAARAFKGQVKAGADPAEDRRAAIAKAAEKRSRTVDRLAEDYAKALPSRAKLRGSGSVSADYAAREIGRLKAAIADMKATGRSVMDLTDKDVRALLRATAAEPGAARHRLARRPRPGVAARLVGVAPGVNRSSAL